MNVRLAVLLVAAGAVGVAATTSQESRPAVTDVRLMTLDPGHFHAALIQKEMYRASPPASTSSRQPATISTSI